MKLRVIKYAFIVKYIDTTAKLYYIILNSEGYGLSDCNWSSHTSLVQLDRIGFAENKLSHYLKELTTSFSNVII